MKRTKLPKRKKPSSIRSKPAMIVAMTSPSSPCCWMIP